MQKIQRIIPGVFLFSRLENEWLRKMVRKKVKVMEMDEWQTGYRKWKGKEMKVMKMNERETGWEKCKGKRNVKAMPFVYLWLGQQLLLGKQRKQKEMTVLSSN